MTQLSMVVYIIVLEGNPVYNGINYKFQMTRLPLYFRILFSPKSTLGNGQELRGTNIYVITVLSIFVGKTFFARRLILNENIDF